MAPAVNQALWDQWRQRIERQRESGLSIAEFCRREHVSSHRFHIWKRKLRQRTSARHGSDEVAKAQRSRKQPAIVTPSRRSHHKPDTPANPPRAPGFLQLPVAAVRTSPWIELALADGTVIRLPQQNLAALVTVLRALRGEQLEVFRGESCRA
jgi:hypothetical protein